MSYTRFYFFIALLAWGAVLAINTDNLLNFTLALHFINEALTHIPEGYDYERTELPVEAEHSRQ